MAAVVIVQRLKNTPQTQSYEIEQQTVDDLLAAADLVEKWWQSRGTIGVLVLNGTAIDSRYEREWIDQKRVPQEWQKRAPAINETGEQAPTVGSPPQQAEPVPASLPPTLYNEEAPGIAPPVLAGFCPCCAGRVHVDDPGDPGTPSGRLDDCRCMACGRPQALTRRAVSQQYAAHQTMLSTDHAQRATPWAPKK
jgi:hypothetical protein